MHLTVHGDHTYQPKLLPSTTLLSPSFSYIKIYSYITLYTNRMQETYNFSPILLLKGLKESVSHQATPAHDVSNVVVSYAGEASKHEEALASSSEQEDVSRRLLLVSPSSLLGKSAHVNCTVYFQEQFYQLLAEIMSWQGRASHHIDLPGRIKQTLVMYENEIQPLFEAQEYFFFLKGKKSI